MLEEQGKITEEQVDEELKLRAKRTENMKKQIEERGYR